MPIRALLKEQGDNPQSFGPDEIAVLVSAYEAALQEVGLVNRNDPATWIIAKRILELAQQGELDPVKLCAHAVADYTRPGSKGS